MPADSQEAKEGISHAEDVARILRHNVIQGLQDQAAEDKYRMCIATSAFDVAVEIDGVVIGLRIHKDIERGDAINVEQATALAKSSGQGCWSR